jgi:hypothetical protein
MNELASKARMWCPCKPWQKVALTGKASFLARIEKERKWCRLRNEAKKRKNRRFGRVESGWGLHK